MTNHTEHAEHIVPRSAYFMVYVALLVLLVVTYAAAHINLHFNLLAAMIIAVIKATMIVLIFMHVRYSERLIWIFSGASFLWLAILIALSLNDYLTRGMLNIAGK